MTAPTCVTCNGTGKTVFLVDKGLMFVGRPMSRTMPIPCVVCRCFCGQPNSAPGGMCEEHESASFVEDDTRHRRAER